MWLQTPERCTILAEEAVRDRHADEVDAVAACRAGDHSRRRRHAGARTAALDASPRGETALDEDLLEDLQRSVPDLDGALPVWEITRDEAEDRLSRALDALMVADTPGVRLTAEQDVQAAEAMCQAIDACEKMLSRTR